MEQMLGMHRRMGSGRKRGLKDTKDEEDEEDDDGDDGEGELEKIVPENVNPERLKAFNVRHRLSLPSCLQEFDMNKTARCGASH